MAANWVLLSAFSTARGSHVTAGAFEKKRCMANNQTESGRAQFATMASFCTFSVAKTCMDLTNQKSPTISLSPSLLYS